MRLLVLEGIRAIDILDGIVKVLKEGVHGSWLGGKIRWHGLYHIGRIYFSYVKLS
jgi:hypothetical protein